MSSKPYGRVRWPLLIGLLLVSLTAVALALYRDYRGFTDLPLTRGPQQTSIDIPRGLAFKDIVRRLRGAGLSPAPPLYWRLLAEELKVSGRLHAGEYALTPGLTPRELLAKMAVGDVIQHRFTIVDGWTFRQLRLALAQDALLQLTLTGLSDADIAKRLALPDDHPEGWFLPETYAFVKGESDLDVLKRAHAAMTKLLDAAWALRAPDLPLTSPYQALILASLVEKETARGDERPLIAGVFVRRLKLGMRLQTDPTVIYGLGDGYDGRIHKRDLETDTPFNTYTRDGLPPTPIALPGKSALAAALHPAPGDALYFVARGDGSHEFSATLEAHNRAVSKYQLHKQP